MRISHTKKLSPPANANGHRRALLRARVLAEEDSCALCLRPVDKNLKYLRGAHGRRCKGTDVCQGCIPHPLSAEVDEDIPRSRGGSPLDRANCHIMHRQCNQAKGARTLAEARANLLHKQATESVTTPTKW